jgi:signal transduction histidine kinase
MASLRPAVTPDSARPGAVTAPLEEHVLPADHAFVDPHLTLVGNAPGPALLLWGADAVCLAYNRHYRSISGLRVHAAGKPLFKAQPELERTWKARLDAAFAGTAGTIDGSAFTGGPDGTGGEAQMGWLLPLAGPSGARGALALFMDASAFLEPTRRLVGALATDLREPLIGIQVVSERLSRLPKPTRERCVEDMDRVLDHSRGMDRLIDDMGAFARRSSAHGAPRLSLRYGDLGSIVRLACERIDAGRTPPTRVAVTDVQGMWDDDAVLRILSSLVTSARQASDHPSVTVELAVAGREGVVLAVKDDGPGMRNEDAEQLFEPWKRGLAPGVERRRRGVGLGLYLARELVHAHGGRIVAERAPHGGFVVRVLLPLISPSGAGPASRTFKTLG